MRCNQVVTADSPERASPPVCRDEPVLHAVRRELPVTTHPDSDRPHPVLVPSEDLAEGVRVTGAVGGKQLGIRPIGQRADPRHRLTATSATWARNRPLPSGPSLVTKTMTS